MQMENKLICRLCLRKEHPRYCKNISPLQDNEESCNILEMLSYCVPEIDIFLVVEPAVCLRCINLLEAAFNFKTECLKNEEKLMKFSQTNDSKVDLNSFYKTLPLVNNNDQILENYVPNVEVIERTNDNKSVSSRGKKFNCSKCYGCENKCKDPIYHKKINLGPLICYNCGIQVDTIEQLRKHVAKHRKHRKCKVCQKHFRDLNQLTIHLRTHTGAKPFICRICGKAFRQKHNRDQHLRQHHGDSALKCNICDKAFSTKYNLKVHTQNMHGKKPNCELCGAVFYTKTALVKHLETDLETCGRKIKEEVLKKPEVQEFKAEPEYVCVNENLQEVFKEEPISDMEYKPTIDEADIAS